MTSMRSVATLLVLSVALVPGRGLAQQGASAGRGGSPAPQVVTTTTIVTGTAFNSRREPLPNARVRLRNLTDPQNARMGQIEATATTNTYGQFTFSGVRGGIYVVELVDNDGDVRASGEIFTVQPGQTVVTFVQLPGRDGGGLAGFWGNASAAAIAAAVALGVTAAKSCDCKVSPER
jgi:hypothetical protein